VKRLRIAHDLQNFRNVLRCSILLQLIKLLFLLIDFCTHPVSKLTEFVQIFFPPFL